MINAVKEASSLFGSSGIRGRVGELVTGQLAINVGLATACLLRQKKSQPKVIVGLDQRTTGPMLASALASGLMAGGCHVTMAGMAPTPTVAYAAGKEGMQASIIVTASHNPPEYNGFKFHNPDGAGFSPDQQSQLERLLPAARLVSWNEFGGLDEVDPIPAHVNALVEASSVSKSHRVVLDAALGVGGLVTPLALRHLDVDLTTLNLPPSGRDYSRGCGPSKIESAAAAEWQHFVRIDNLCAIVRATGAEVGLAHDGDADRLLVIDNLGRPLAGDTLLAIVADYYLATRGGKIIATTVSSSSVVDHVAERHGAKVVRCRVGDVFVSQLVKEHQATLGGEPSGPLIFPEVHLCPDGPLAACKVLEILDWARRPLSDLVDELPPTHLLRESLPCPEKDKGKVVSHVASALDGWPEVEEVSKVDGVRASFDDASWVLIRPSGTEPLIRITVEARSSQRAKKLLERARSLIRQASSS